MKNGPAYKDSILFLLHITSNALIDCKHYIIFKAKLPLRDPRRYTTERKLPERNLLLQSLNGAKRFDSVCFSIKDYLPDVYTLVCVCVCVCVIVFACVCVCAREREREVFFLESA